MGELQSLNVVIGNQAMHDGGLVIHIFIIGEGTTSFARVGKYVSLRTIEMRGRFFMNSTASTMAWTTLMLVYDRLPRPTLPATDEILRNIKPDAMQYEGNEDRFRIMWRKTLIMERGSSLPEAVNFHAEVNVNLPAIYKGTVGSIGEVLEGAIYLVAVGDNGPTSSNFARLDMQAQLRFTDDP